MRPAAIVAFERLFVLKIAIGIPAGLYLMSLGAVLPADVPARAARYVPWAMAAGVVLGTLIDLGLLYFIARRGSNNAARWALAILFAIGVVNLVRMQASHAMAMPLVSMLSIAAQLLLDAICLWLIFREDARPWFRR